MATSLLGQLFSSLYELVRKEAEVRRRMSRTEAGHVFEDVTAQKIYSQARSLGLKPHPPRHTLSYPTFSGGTYQFDASFSLGDVTYVIECKRTKMPAKVHIHYFNSQILDYLLGAKMRQKSFTMIGIFLSTVRVRESSMIYAIAHGITIIDPISPPLEYMISTLSEGSVLFKTMRKLLDKWPGSSSIFDFHSVRRWTASDLLKEYRFLCKRWRNELETYTCA